MIKKKVYFALSSVALFLYALDAVAVAFCFGNTIDAAIAKDMNLFVQVLLLTLLVMVLNPITYMISRVFMQNYAKCCIVEAKRNRFEHFMRQSPKESTDIGEFSANVDLLYDKNYINRVLMVQYVLQFVLSVASIVYLSWKIFLVVLITMLLPMLVPMLLQKMLTNATEGYTNQVNKYLAFVQDALQGNQEIRMYKAYDYFRGIHTKLNQAAEKARMKNNLLYGLNNGLSSFVSSLAFLATLAICGYLTITGEVTMGVLIAIIQLLNGIMGPINAIASASGEMTSTKELAKQFAEKDITEEEAPVHGTGEAAHRDEEAVIAKLSASNISFGYTEDKEVLKDVSFDFKRGKKYAILGESGTGKTTFAKVLAGLLEDYRGTVKAVAEDGTVLDFQETEAHIQYVAQEPYVFRISAADNVTLGKEDGKDMDVCINALGIRDLFQNDDEFLANRDRISGGQKQRLVIARALYHQPDVLILDEPTANLDAENSDKVMDLIRNSGCGILIVITHNNKEEFLSAFDEVICMNDGRLS